MIDELLAKLDGLRRNTNITNVPLMWEEEIRIMQELKTLGCHKVFGGLEIDAQIHERQELKRLFTKLQDGEFKQS